MSNRVVTVDGVVVKVKYNKEKYRYDCIAIGNGGELRFTLPGVTNNDEMAIKDRIKLFIAPIIGK
jgi:hypothetical protein